jgi:uncharacterized membrane protein YeaQ/YmgE (transglycosylase-associated protein family)
MQAQRRWSKKFTGGNKDKSTVPEEHRSGVRTGVPDRGGNVSFFVWIVLGLAAGFIASKIVNKQGQGIFLDIILGIVGAVVGGFIFNLFGASATTGLNLYSLLVAVVGAIVVLFAYHAVRHHV